MTVEQINEMREFINISKPYVLYGDNERLFYGSTPSNIIIWDDENKICYALRLSNEPPGTKRVFEVVVIDYDNVQYVYQLVDDFEMIEKIDILKTNGLIDDEEIKNIKLGFNIKL